MHFLKQFAHGTFVSLLGFLVLVAIVTYAVVLPLTNQTTVTSWLDKSDVYGQVTDVAIEQTKNPNENGESLTSQFEGSPVPVTDIYDAARETFSANFWQSNIESMLANVYAWLEGGEELTFAIDIGEQNDVFVSELERKVQLRLAELPECTSFAEIENYSLRTANCLPSNVSVNQAASSFVSEFRSEDSPLANAEISAESIDLEPQQQERIQKGYAALTFLPWLALGLFVLIAGLAIVTARSKIMLTGKTTRKLLAA